LKVSAPKLGAAPLPDDAMLLESAADVDEFMGWLRDAVTCAEGRAALTLILIPERRTVASANALAPTQRDLDKGAGEAESLARGIVSCQGVDQPESMADIQTIRTVSDETLDSVGAGLPTFNEEARAARDALGTASFHLGGANKSS
jgi:hypothetical protein